jgi:hypothetical protein
MGEDGAGSPEVGVWMSSGTVDIEFSVIGGKKNGMLSMTHRGGRRKFAECSS